MFLHRLIYSFESLLLLTNVVQHAVCDGLRENADSSNSLSAPALHAENFQSHSALRKDLTKPARRAEIARLLKKDLTQVTRSLENSSSETHGDVRSTKKANVSTGVCSSAKCLQVAAQIKSSLNTSVDPCEDFYMFACGGWKKEHEIPRSENEITAFTMLTQEIQKAIYDLLQEPESPDESEALKKARKFYKSCMDVEEIERLGPKPALEFIKYIGDWPLCDNPDWNETNWKVYDVLEKLQRNFYPAPPFFTVEVTNDHLNSTKHLIKIDQSGLSLQREIYFKHEKIMEDYARYMTNVAKLLGHDCPNIADEMKGILKFEKDLAKITTPAEAKQAGTFRRINLKILEAVVPQFPWHKHIKGIFPEAQIERSEVILATAPLYLYRVTELIQGTPKKILAKYIVWQMLRDKISFLSKAFRKARAEFNKNMTGVEDIDPRWRTCTSVTNDNMGVPIGTLYVQKYFSESTRQKTVVMIDEIIQAFKERIKHHTWIDDKTRKGVIDKTDALVAKVGYATYILQPTELNKRFQKLHVDDKKFFENNLDVDKWIRYRLFNKLRKPVDKSKWPMFPQTINAMYQFYENEIGTRIRILLKKAYDGITKNKRYQVSAEVIPAGILQPPFFYSGDVPRSLSYGAIGSIIGHEMTHGFDNTGRKFDKNGDIVKEWWSDNALKEFNKRAKCMEKQYSKYKVQNKYPMSGKLTLGENIADNGGTKLAYDAYMDWLDKNGAEPNLPELDYNNKQLFFIGYAQEYCANVREKTEQIATLSEIHSPSKFRVIGTLSNFDAFSRAFQCSNTSAMNPKVKCEVW